MKLVYVLLGVLFSSIAFGVDIQIIEPHLNATLESPITVKAITDVPAQCQTYWWLFFEPTGEPISISKVKGYTYNMTTSDGLNHEQTYFFNNGRNEILVECFENETSNTTSSVLVHITNCEDNCDIDGDGIFDQEDNCPADYNPNQKFICKDSDNDGIRDEEDYCPNTKENMEVDNDGCSIDQFCSQFSCGLSCLTADWKNNEDEIYPKDCTIVIPMKEGKYLQPKCVATEMTNMCGN